MSTPRNISVKANSNYTLTTRNHALDAIRIFACVMVVAYHASATASLQKYFDIQSVGAIFQVGHIRQPIFFVLSGFVLAKIYLLTDKKVLAGDFIIRRLLKVYPMYWVATLLTLAAIYLIDAPEPTATKVLESITLLPAVTPLLNESGPLLVYPAWTLQYEVVAYFIFSILILVKQLRVIVLLAWPLLWIFFSESTHSALRYIASEWLLLIWIGGLAAFFSRFVLVPLDLFRNVSILLVLALGGFLVLAYIDNININVLLGIFVVAPMICVASFSRWTIKSTQWRRRFEILVQSTYCTFILHALVVTPACHFFKFFGITGSVAILGVTLLSIVLAFGLGILFEFKFNTPLARYFDGLIRSRRSSKVFAVGD